MIAQRFVYIIIPVHNRKEITLACLDHLNKIGDLEHYHIVVVDDGSTDGTAAAIQALYPNVKILFGDGNLWWTGAIVKGMQYAYEQGAEFFVWLNDDTLPSKGTLQLLVSKCLESSNKITSAQCYVSTDFKVPTYGGQKKIGLSVKLLYTPPDQILSYDCLSGNLVCLPRSVIKKLGYPPKEKLPHSWADIVYTWEAKQVGYELEVLGNARAVCEFNPLEEGWATSPIPMRKRWALITSPKSNLYPKAYWNYCKIFYKKLAVLLFLQVYFRLIVFTILRSFIPLPIIKKVKLAKDKSLSFNRHI